MLSIYWKMETLIDQLRIQIDPIMQSEGFTFEKDSYIKVLDEAKGLYCEYQFEIRKKIGGDYYFLHIKINILHESISRFLNSININRIELDFCRLSKYMKRNMIKELQNSRVIATLSQWSDIDDLFRTKVTMWSCSIYDIQEIEDFKQQFLELFNKGNEWISKASDWDFLVKWNIDHRFYDRALCILKFLGDKEQFASVKESAIKQLQGKKQYLELLEEITIN